MTSLEQQEATARERLRQNPFDKEAHTALGAIFCQQSKWAAASFHLSRAPQNSPSVQLNLGNAFKATGQLEEAEACYAKSYSIDPKRQATLLAWANLKEISGNFEAAADCLTRAEALTGSACQLERAVLLHRQGDLDLALSTLARPQNPGFLFERGRIRDEMGDFPNAWVDWREANRHVREAEGKVYNFPLAASIAGNSKQVFTKETMDLFPKEPMRTDTKSLFIVGYPRSGTTLIETTLAKHPDIMAGDELNFIYSLTRSAQRRLSSPYDYPLCLRDAWAFDRRRDFAFMAEWYSDHLYDLFGPQQYDTFITDKMPLNETYLGFINALFPQAHVIHVMRHPLDVLVSNFGNYLTHGFNQSFSLQSIVKHMNLIDGLNEHWWSLFGGSKTYQIVRYEDFVRDPDKGSRELLDFLGLAPDVRTEEGIEEYKRTASYATANGPVTDKSIGRWKNYADQLETLIPFLEKTIERGGWRV